MQLGMIGLGRMGANMVRRLLKGGHECVVFDMSAKAVAELGKEKAIGTASLAEFTKRLTKPRAVWLMVPAGVVDHTITDLLPYRDRGDILVDGGNSYYIDDIRRAKELATKGIHYVDVGTSGGVWGLERGYCMMIGGETDPVKGLGPIFPPLAPGPRRAAAAFPARQGGRRQTAQPSKDICIAGRVAPAISSRWCIMGSNMAGWRPMPKGWPSSKEPMSASKLVSSMRKRRRSATRSFINTISICRISPRFGAAAA